MSFSGDTRPVAVIGVTGQLGSAFSQRLPSALNLTRSDLDLTSPATVGPTIERLNPSAVFNCAAYTNVDRAEQEEDIATVINGEAVGALASVTAAMNIPFVTFSTDYVFDGEETTPYVESSRVDPINAYGRSKLVGERLATKHNPDSLIVRTSWVVSGTHDNFVSTMLRLASEPGSQLRVVDDQVGCPTIAEDLATASLAALREGVTGLLHLANGPAATWFDVAALSVSRAGLPGVVTPCATSEFPRPAVRPLNSVLASERLGSLPFVVMPPWQKSIPAVVAEQMRRLSLSG